MVTKSRDEEFSISKSNIKKIDFLKRIDFSYEEAKIFFDYSNLSIDEFSMNMQLENDIEGLVKLEGIDEKANALIYSCKNLKDINLKEIDLRFLGEYFRSILSLQKSLKKYFLSPEKCLWTCFFSFDKDAKIQVINLPILESFENQSIGDYMREVLSKTSFTGLEEVQIISKYYALANMGINEENYSSILQNQGQSDLSKGNITRSPEKIEDNKIYNEELNNKARLIIKKASLYKNCKLIKNKLYKTIKTIFDKKEKFTANKLFDKEGNEIKIDKYIYLGSDIDKVDILIKDQGAAPIHTIVMKKENVIYVEDNNTIDGTLINNKRITTNTLFPLKDGDVLGFGMDKDFLFARYVEEKT